MEVQGLHLLDGFQSRISFSRGPARRHRSRNGQRDVRFEQIVTEIQVPDLFESFSENVAAESHQAAYWREALSLREVFDLVLQEIASHDSPEDMQHFIEISGQNWPSTELHLFTLQRRLLHEVSGKSNCC